MFLISPIQKQVFCLKNLLGRINVFDVGINILMFRGLFLKLLRHLQQKLSVHFDLFDKKGKNPPLEQPEIASKDPTLTLQISARNWNE